MILPINPIKVPVQTMFLPTDTSEKNKFFREVKNEYSSTYVSKNAVIKDNMSKIKKKASVTILVFTP